MEYLRKGNVPTHRRNTFAKFAANWWVPGECLYLKEQEASGYKKSVDRIIECAFFVWITLHRFPLQQ
jgi:hypothetical protein